MSSDVRSSAGCAWGGTAGCPVDELGDVLFTLAALASKSGISFQDALVQLDEKMAYLENNLSSEERFDV